MDELIVEIRAAFEHSQKHVNYFPHFSQRVIEKVVKPRIGDFDEIQYRHQITQLRHSSKLNGFNAKKFLKYVADMTNQFIVQHEKKHGKKSPIDTSQSELFNSNQKSNL